MLNPQDGADQRRGDIKVSSKHGNTWILDGGVVWPPGPTQCYVDQGSECGTTPGLAAEAYAAVKAATKTTPCRSSRKQVDASTKQPATGATL